MYRYQVWSVEGVEEGKHLLEVESGTQDVGRDFVVAKVKAEEVLRVEQSSFEVSQVESPILGTENLKLQFAI